MPRTLTLEEALQEFDAEVERLEAEEQLLQYQYDTGQWATAPVYCNRNR